MTDVTPEPQAVDLDELVVDEQLIARLAGRARAGGLQMAGEGGLLAQLTKRLVESALEAEITDHLGYGKHDAGGRDGGNQPRRADEQDSPRRGSTLPADLAGDHCGSSARLAGLQTGDGRIRIHRRGRGRPRTRPGRVLGDKAFSSRGIRSHLRRRRIGATIPEPADQTKNRLRRGGKGGRPPTFDTEIYKQRNVVERAINKLKGHRGRHSLRQARLHVPRNHRRRLDPDLAPRPVP